jgi:hypothetical protein
MDINELETKNNMHDNDIVNIVIDKYKGVDRPLVVKVRKPDRYGIRFIEDVERMIIESCAVKPCERRRRDGHRLQYSLRCRVSKRKLDRVHTSLNQFRFPTTRPTVQTFTDYATDFALENPEQFQRFIDKRDEANR